MDSLFHSKLAIRENDTL